MNQTNWTHPHCLLLSQLSRWVYLSLFLSRPLPHTWRLTPLGSSNQQMSAPWIWCRSVPPRLRLSDQNLCFFRTKSLVSPNVSHEPRAIDWTAESHQLSGKTNVSFPCFCECLWAEEREKKGKNCRERFTYSLSSPVIQGRILHQRHSVLLMDVPRIPRSQGNHLR